MTDTWLKRDYGRAESAARAIGAVSDRQQRMRIVVDAIWDIVRGLDVSWVGFYLRHEGHEEMTLGPCRDKPACTPITLDGACGRCWREGRSLLIEDVGHLGQNYVACDPNDRSELVVPCFDQTGACWGVFDADSFERASFKPRDAEGVWRVLVAAGLTSGDPPTMCVI